MRDSYFSKITVPFKKRATVDGTVSADSDQFDLFSTLTPSAFAPYMQDEESFASILYRIAKNTLGAEIDEWELETLVIELKERYPDIPDITLDKIMAIIAMKSSFDGSFSFYNEVNCFKNTVNAFNGIDPDYEFMGELIPQHISWAMYEMDQLFPGYKLSEEPAKFLGLCFHSMGYLLLPDSISEYQEFLDYYNKNTELKPRVQEAKDNNTKDVEDLDPEDLLELQILMQKSNEDYVRIKKDQYLKDLALYK